MKKLDTSKVISRFKQIHNDFYDYSKVQYNGKRDKITVVCPTHGDFEILPSNHWKGQGCKECGYLNRNNRRVRPDDYLKYVRNQHNQYYDYSKTEYTTARNYIIVTCPTHGDFKIKAGNHKGGQGCRECGNDLNPFRKVDWVKRGSGKNATGLFYIIECKSDTELFYKFGITFMKLKYRYAESRMPYKWKLLRSVESDDLNYIWDLEKRFKRKVIKRKYVPEEQFSGHSTECFI